MRVLGVHSSPFRTGNTALVLDVALEEAAKTDGVMTEAIALAGLAIGDCRHCNWCITQQTPEKLCSIEDDASPILQKIRECDVLMLASPVYFGRMSGSMACLIDRTRCFMFGKSERLALKGKVGVALAVGWSRSFGLETTLASMHTAFLMHEMLTPSSHAAGALYGAAAVSGQRDENMRYKREKLGVRDDREGLHCTRLLVQEALRIAGERGRGRREKQ